MRIAHRKVESFPPCLIPVSILGRALLSGRATGSERRGWTDGGWQRFGTYSEPLWIASDVVLPGVVADVLEIYNALSSFRLFHVFHERRNCNRCKYTEPQQPRSCQWIQFRKCRY